MVFPSIPMRNASVAVAAAAATAAVAASTSTSSTLSAPSRLTGLLLLAARGRAEGSSSGAATAALAVFAARRFSSSSSPWPPRGAAVAAAPARNGASAPSPSAPPPGLPLRSPTLAVWGADTGVGKTLVSAGLAAAAVSAGGGARGGRRGVLFVKPVQTGFPADDDAAVVAGAAAAAAEAAASAAGKAAGAADSAFQLVHGRHASEAKTAAAASRGGGGDSRSSPNSDADSSLSSLRRAVTQHAWRLPASPHAAVALEGRGVSDAELARELAREIGAWEEQFLRSESFGASATAAEAAPPSSSCPLPPPPLFDSLVLAETAGGPLSPSPSGSLQADAWRSLRLPPLLVASPRLGGVSATLAAAEALVSRGHGAPVAAVVLAGENNSGELSRGGEGGGARIPAGHVEALEEHLGALGVPLVVLPRACPPPPLPSSSSPSPLSPSAPFPRPPDPALAAWLREASPGLLSLLRLVDNSHAARLRELRALASDAAAVFWWPFTQHADLGRDPASSVLAIDSRAGEHLISVRQEQEAAAAGAAAGAGAGGGGGRGLELAPLYDACASWWTQGAAGADPAASARLARSLAASAARYGHVIHPEAAHEPGVRAAKLLLGEGGPGRGWASRVFWSDDG